MVLCIFRPCGKGQVVYTNRQKFLTKKSAFFSIAEKPDALSRNPSFSA
jgi:hypothetical protein